MIKMPVARLAQWISKIRDALTLKHVLIALTVIWLTVAFALGWFAHPSADCDAETYRCLSANEWGDFLAGVFAPIAFLWLVGTVVIQSDELREQRNELAVTRDVMRLQADEAKKQAEFIGVQTLIFQQEKNDEQLRMKLKQFRHFILLSFSDVRVTRSGLGGTDITRDDVGELTKDPQEDVELFFLEVLQRLRSALYRSIDTGLKFQSLIDCRNDTHAQSLISVLRSITDDYGSAGPAMKTLLQTSGALLIVDDLPSALEVQELPPHVPLT